MHNLLRFLLPLLAILTLPTGCFQRPPLAASDHPKVKMGTHRPADARHLGLVEVRAAGSFRSCTALLSEAMDKLTVAASAVGGTRVEGISFRGRWRWQSNRPLCRSHFLWVHKSVSIRGYAVSEIAELPFPEASVLPTATAAAPGSTMRTPATPVFDAPHAVAAGPAGPAVPVSAESATVSALTASLTSEVADRLQPFSSTVDGAFQGWGGDTVVVLANGQVWRQADTYVYRCDTVAPKAVVFSDEAGYRMIVEACHGKDEKPVKVSRLR
ncbi:MAG: hypothetical protein V3V08_08290 [Nannocystaceae bacterium]